MKYIKPDKEYWKQRLMRSGIHYSEQIIVGVQKKNSTGGGIYIMTSSNGNILRVTGPLWGESTGDWWISLTKASDVGHWYFLWSVPEPTVEQTIETSMIWDDIALIMASM